MPIQVCPDDGEICPFGATDCTVCLSSRSQPVYGPKIYHKVSIPKSVRNPVMERDNFTCQICGSTDNPTIDHIYPERLGGKATLDNCQVLCKSCNSRKGAYDG